MFFEKEIHCLSNWKAKRKMDKWSYIYKVLATIHNFDNVLSKEKLIDEIVNTYGLVKDRKIYFNDNLAIRFSYSKNGKFSNTVLSLSHLQKYDDRPVFVCLNTPLKNILFLCNTTFLKKISHSSKDLTIKNIVGSFNGGDIIMDFSNDLKNEENNFQELFEMHKNSPREENLERLVNATNDIKGISKKFFPLPKELDLINSSIKRAIDFNKSRYFKELNQDLLNRLNKVHNEIIIASLIEDVNLRGRIIEYLITHSSADALWNDVIKQLKEQSFSFPNIKTDNDLGDYNRDFIQFNTKTDIKTKILVLESCPKGYNIDKLLKFLSSDNSIYMLFIVGIDNSKDNEKIVSKLCSVFELEVMKATVITDKWAGRNTRGCAQFRGKNIRFILNNTTNEIDEELAQKKLNEMLEL